MSAQRLVIGVPSVPRQRPGWEISERTMPESVIHDQVGWLLREILQAQKSRLGPLYVARNLAVKWVKESPRIGLDPDVAILAPPPPDVASVRSIRTWIDGQEPPNLAIEIVSHTNPNKDYLAAPEKYAASGIGEMWIFDPLLSGPKAHGGPFRLQIWCRQGDDFVRLYAGDGPGFSPFLNAWAVPTEEGHRLRIADDAAATSFWLTREESEREAKEAESAAKEVERAAKEAAIAEREAALARVAELEALLAKKD